MQAKKGLLMRYIYLVRKPSYQLAYRIFLFSPSLTLHPSRAVYNYSGEGRYVR